MAEEMIPDVPMNTAPTSDPAVVPDHEPELTTALVHVPTSEPEPKPEPSLVAEAAA